MNPSTNGTTWQDPSQVRALIKEPTTKDSTAKPPAKEVSNDWRNDRGRATVRDPLGKRFKRILFGIGLVLILAVGGLYFFAQTASYESTDDAFVDGHIMNVAPKIAGRIDKVLIDDNQLLKKGDPIVEIDPRDYDAQLRQKQAALDSTKAQAAAAQASVEQQIAHAKSLEATLDQDKADQQASEAQTDQTADYLRRQQDLYNHRVVSIQDLTNSRDSNRSAQANLDSAKMKVLSADAQVVEGQAQVRTYAALLQYALAQEQANEANVEAAQLNDSYTKIFAPESGRVTHKSVEPGDYVQVGQNLLALIPSNIWVTANFKENQLRLMRPGQPVEIEVDALGGRTFKGHVNSIQMGSGAAFSLLPPENATGNYVKVVQRVPVKILFDSIPDVGLPLGPGDSVVPTVKVQDFRYSGSQLLVVAALTGAAILGVLWWGTRTPKAKKEA
jgi:membrane fusion protein (multidrug efflux system)